MKITTQGEYGLRCLMNIARGRGEPVTIEEICRREAISLDYVEQLLMRLRKAGEIQSQKGPGGGYLLSRSPEDIKVRDVVLALETAPFEVICRKFMQKKRKCVNVNTCKVKKLWQRLAEAQEKILAEVSIADLM